MLWDFFDLTGARVKKTVDGVALIIGLIDSTGKRVVSYQYDRWGKTVSITGTLAATVGKKNPFRYRGYYFEAESGMYYLQSRYYDPEVKMYIEREKLSELIKKRVDEGMAIEDVAKEFGISNEIIYTWLTIRGSEKGIKCERKQQEEELIIDKFFKDCKKDRAKYLLGHEKKENTIFDNMISRQLNEDKMHKEKDASIESIFRKLAGITHCNEVYIFSREIKGWISLTDLYKLDILELQETIIYFKKDYAYFQHEADGYRRERYILF